MTGLPFDVVDDAGLLPFDRQRPDRYSMSFRRSMQECMLAAAMARETDDPSGEDALLGRLVHEAAAGVGFVAIMRGVERIAPAEAERIAERVLAHPEEQQPLSAHHYEQVLTLIGRWALRASFPVDADVMAVELSFRDRLAPSGRILSARIDKLTIRGSCAEIVDYKSGRGMPSDSEWEKVEAEPARRPQLADYAWHVRQRHPHVVTFILTEDWLRFSKPFTLVLTADDVDRHERFLRTHVERIDDAYREQHFPPNPGSWCAYCPDSSRCPLPERVRPHAPRTPAAASEQLDALLVDRARVKRRETILRVYTDLHGPVTSGNQTIGHYASQQRRIDESLAKAAGVDLDAFRVAKHVPKFETKRAR